jgi:hypothetical protein
MQIEKKLIACSILAIAIGIATVVPLAFLMTPTSASAQITDDPWFNLNINYATCEAKTVFSSNLSAMYSYTYNYTTNPNAIDTQNGARIEYFRIQIYSDQGQLVNQIVALAANCTENINPIEVQFARQDWFNTSNVQGSAIDFAPNFNGALPADIGYSAHCFTTEQQEQIEKIQNAQTIYIDICRVGYITYTGNDTVVSFANNEVAQHYELTKTGNGFSYGVRPAGYSADLVPGQTP